MYDTLTGKRQKLPENVRIFLCGPTVYDDLHIGHARMLLFYDLVLRYLQHNGAKVTALVNVTDVDPKISSRAKETGASPQIVADEFIEKMLADCLRLQIDGFVFARVSRYVDFAVKAIRQLLARKSAYCADGNVYLDTTNVRGFGQLSESSRQDLDDCRLDISRGKRSPSDILIWNATDDIDIKFDDKVLGNGFPWWHMQDTSVVLAVFGGRYDIHGGATELVYPHHEFHLAQLRAVTGVDNPVLIWSHVGLVYLRGHKMSKSAGNVVKVRELLGRYSANAIRLYLYSKKYHDRFDFSIKDLEKFQQMDDGIRQAIAKKSSKKTIAFQKCLEDDFDTPAAMEIMKSAAGQDLLVMARILGLRY